MQRSSRRWFLRRRPRTRCATSPPVVRGYKPSPRVRAPPCAHPFQGSPGCHCEGTRAIARTARSFRATRTRTQKSRWFSRRRPRTPCATSPPVVRGHKPSPRVRAPPRTHPFQGSACCHCERTRAVCAMARAVRASEPTCNGRRFGGFREADHARRVPPPLPSSEGISPRRACAHPLVRTLSKAPQVVIAREHVP